MPRPSQTWRVLRSLRWHPRLPRLALRGTLPSYSAVFAAVSNAPVDVLAEVRALVPGAVPHLSNLIRAMMATADHGGGAAAMGLSAAPPPPDLAPALANGRARTSPGSTNADGRADGAGPAAPRLPVAMQTPDAANITVELPC